MKTLKMVNKNWYWIIIVFVFFCSSAYALDTTSFKNFRINHDGSLTLANYIPLEVTKGLVQKIGFANPNQTLDLRIIMPLNNMEGLNNFITNLYNPKSPVYHKYLTSQQFAQLYGSSLSNTTEVEEFLTSFKFSVISQSANGFVLTASGSVSAVENAFFKGEKHIYNYKNINDGTIYFAPDTNPSIPTQVLGEISAIGGLDNLHKLNSSSQQFISNPQTSLKPKTSPLFNGPGGGLSPTDFIKAYNISAVPSNGIGQTVALVEFGGYTSSDITFYENYFNSSKVPLENILIDGVNGTGTNPEATGDIELLAAMAPGLSKILVYLAPDTYQGTIDEYNRIASDNAAPIISSSWGLAESAAGPFITFDQQIFPEFAAQGQGWFQASGDTGGIVVEPAAQPYATGVGITILSSNSDGSYKNETGSSESGGGPSTIEPIPSYQVGMASKASGGSTTLRNTPDLALDADFSSSSTCYSLYIGGTWTLYGGSSLSTPLWAGFIARVNQGRATPIGFINPTIYAIAKGTNYTVDLHDITSGSNGYPAVSGYDLVTGLGSINGVNLYNDLAGSLTPTGLTASPGNAQISLSWNGNSKTVSYNIYRGTTNNGPYPTLVKNVATTSYIDTGLTNGTTYYYVVTSLNSLGEESPDSSQASATPIAPPLAPTGVNSHNGNTQATLSWNASATATSYNVKRSTTNGSGYSTIGTVAGLSYTDNGLQNSTPYYYVITGINAGGESPNSSQTTITPLATLPLAPIGLKAAADNQQITLSWNASVTATSYNIKRSTTSGGPYTTISTNGAVTTTPYTDKPLTNGTTYYYVISAVNATGEGANSVELNAAANMPAPTNLQSKLLGAKIGTQVINGGISLTWTQSISPGIIQNKIYRSSNGGSYSLLATISATTSYTDENMPKGVTYSYKITAFSSAGVESVFSNVVNINF